MGTTVVDWERRRELEETVLALRLARKGAAEVDGWIRTLRRTVGLPVAALAGRLGVGEGEIFRLEGTERRGAIEMRSLRRAAEALGCDLVYGLVPRVKNVGEMAAEVDAARWAKRAAARERRRARDRRRRRGIPEGLEEEPAWRERMRKEARKMLRGMGLRAAGKK